MFREFHERLDQFSFNSADDRQSLSLEFRSDIWRNQIDPRCIMFLGNLISHFPDPAKLEWNSMFIQCRGEEYSRFEMREAMPSQPGPAPAES